MAERRRSGGRSSGGSSSNGQSNGARSRKTKPKSAQSKRASGSKTAAGSKTGAKSTTRSKTSARSKSAARTRSSAGSKPAARSKAARSKAAAAKPAAEAAAASPLVEHESHQPSHEDAMGQDKRRQVVGHSYGPSRRSQVMFFGIVAVVLVVIIGGWTLAVAAFDTAPETYPDKAPWSNTSQLSPTRSPSGPCGEPGNAYPPPADSPCVTDTPAETGP
jgi:cobalamin biosynthesis Mg chelatase CobN